MKYKIIEPRLPFHTGIIEWEDGTISSIFTERDEEFVKLNSGKDFIGFGWNKNEITN